MNSGTMINSIFGFCDIRQFTDTTECLQEEVMLFVNRIAHILHGIVVQCSGSANKNIGDAFLLTWKIDDSLSGPQKSQLADKALLAFCKSLIELSRHQEFICNFSVGATARLYKRFPNYKVRIGAGLHYGWAIEGAIGSNRKIDASYLSPNVNFTEYLESSTKAYGVPLLISEPFYNMLSPAAAKSCRQVDRIKRSEGDEPIGLYTYDCDMNIDWNDESRHAKKAPKASLRTGGRRKSFQGGLAGMGMGMNKQMSQSKVSISSVPPKAVEKAESNTKIQMLQKAGLSFRASATGAKLGGVASPMLPNAETAMRVKPSMSNAISMREAPGGGAASMTMRKAPQAGDSGGPDAEAGEGTMLDRAKRAPTIVILPYRTEMWEVDSDLVELRHLVNNKNFTTLWESGINAYINGEWQKARDIFHETVKLSGVGVDGPSKFLIETIDAHGGTAPHGWQGYRVDGDGH
jgi:class 3 adenylate cyclase